MIVLGINAFGHDAAAVLLIDGKVAFAASEERFDRVRHSAAFPQGAIHAALTHAGIGPGDVDRIAFPWTRGMGRLPKAWHVLRHLPRSRAYFREPPDTLLPDRQSYLKQMRGLERRLKDEGFRAKVHRVPHHMAHAVSATLQASKGEEIVALTADGMGEWTTAALWRAPPYHPPERIRCAVYPHSPGKAYAAVTAWLGFRPESDEGKTMGLAAYGQEDTPGYRFARGLLRPDSKALLRVRTSAFGFPWGEARLYGDAFLETLGPPRAVDEPIRDGDADVALGIQHAVEAFALEVAAGLADTPWWSKSLGLAGGLFLNCAMNGRLAREENAPLVLPFPVAGDAGAAWGAAVHVFQDHGFDQAERLETLCLGTLIRADDAKQALANEPHARHADDLDTSLAEAVAARIAEGHVVGVARGRAEFGPRALGARSVLASPTTTAKRDDVNARKGRESWRPLAPIVREEDERWFEEQALAIRSPWMIQTFVATARARKEIPGVVHADGTARVQTVTRAASPFLYAVLDALVRAGEPGVVINTSLNRRGEPIVDTAAQALTAARAMGLDAVVLDDWLVPLGGSPAE
ncbi:MAG: carbamoyltransferase C-terminal domain-containing protein [Planctomycetota bacterium]|nr:carbamoyltransferase C-terminal domain-containing protein [Planctomycetota bacterium]